MFGGDFEDQIREAIRRSGYSSKDMQNRANNSLEGQNRHILNTIELKKEVILVFDLSGKKIISVEIKDDLETNEYGERVHNGQKVLSIEFENNEALKYNLPKSFIKRKIEHTFVNGILEVFLKK